MHLHAKANGRTDSTVTGTSDGDGYGRATVTCTAKTDPAGSRKRPMGIREDVVNALRRSAIPQIHYLFEGSFDGYAVSHTTAEEYALTAHCSEDQLEELLSGLGFSRNPIASLKVRTDGNTSEGSWVWRRHPLADCQLHVVLHALEDRDECVDVYAHWEYSWIRHPYAHYVARGYDADRGVAITRELFGLCEGHELGNGDRFSYEVDDGPSRQASEALSVSHYRVKEWAIGLRDRLPIGDGEDDHEEKRDGERDRVSPRITDEF